MTNIMSPDRLHLRISDSGGGAIKWYASSTLGIPLTHVFIGHGLHPSLGPLDMLTNPRVKLDWINTQKHELSTVLGHDASREVEQIAELETFWTQIHNWKADVTVWHSSRNASDASFLLVLAKHVERIHEFDFVDISRLSAGRRNFLSVGECRPEDIAEAARQPYKYTDGDITAARHQYDTLASQSLGLRRFQNGILTEATADSFDDEILEYLTPQWQNLARVFAYITMPQREQGFKSLDYYTLLWRFHVLVAERKIMRRNASELPLYEADPLAGEVMLDN